MQKLSIEFHDRDYQRLLRQKTLDGFADKPMAEYLAWRFGDTPLDPALHEMITQGTRSELAPLWMNNFAENLPWIRGSDAKTLRDIAAPEPVDRRCVVIGRGPSAFSKEHLSIIYESDVYHNDELTVVACDGMFKECLSKGILPNYVVSVDGSPVVKKWYDELEPKQFHLYADSSTPIRVIVSTQIHPSAFQALRLAYADIYWFMPAADSIDATHSVTRNLMLMTCTKENANGVVSMDCGGNVGAASWVIAWHILKHRRICLVGMDMGYPQDMPLDETYYWDRTLQRLPTLQAYTCYKTHHNPFYDEWYRTDPVFEHYRNTFLDMAVRTPDWVETCNASSGTLYYPPFIKPVDLEEWLR